MAKEETIPSKTNTLPSPEDFFKNKKYSVSSCSSPSSSSASSFPFSSSPNGHTNLEIFNGRYRSKSMSNILPDAYSAGDVRRIRERLLRTNSRVVRPQTFKYFSRNQKMTLASLALVDFMSFCSMSIMAPFFPREAAEKGLSDSLSGFVFSFYAIVMFITSPIFGKILPKIGAKFMFISGIFIAGVCNLIFGTLEYVENYELFTVLCITIRGFEALGASAFSTASYVFVVNTFPQNIGAVLGILETFVGIGMSLGPALGGLLYSIGGFAVPFFVLGVSMLLIIPINIFLLPVVDDCNVTKRSESMFSLIKIPAVVIIGFVVVIVSSVWSFLDPTLEPHLRQFNLTAEKVGLIFLLFSTLYGISSPFWGWMADKMNNHWFMMVIGLFMCTIGLLLLGPSPYLTFLSSSLWLNIVALSILGISVALALLPTFQEVLTSAINSGCHDSIATYSMVAGIWSCMYSLGEVVGPLIGGFLLQIYGFPLASTVIAFCTFLMAIVTIVFSIFKSFNPNNKQFVGNGTNEDSWKISNSTIEESLDETTSLLHDSLDSNHPRYTEDVKEYYESIRKIENYIEDMLETNQRNPAISKTAKGSCEV